MGFFDTLGKIIHGQPLHEPVSTTSASNETVAGVGQQAGNSTRTSTGQKVTPEVRVSRISTRRNGDTMVSHGWVQNNSPLAVELRSLAAMGRTSPMNYHLDSGKGRQVQLYSGPVAQHERDHDDAHIDFRIVQNGDYFRQEFHVEFDRQSDGKFLIEEFHAEDVRDI